MWRIFLAFVVHRLFLFVVAMVVLNGAVSSSSRSSNLIPEVQSSSRLWNGFRARLADGPEAAAIADLARIPLTKVLKATSHPYLLILRWWTGLTGMNVSVSLLIWSNIFLLLFLWELYVLLTRIVTSDTASAASILLVLWPTSFEMSLGSGLGLLGFLAVGAVRHGLESRWLLSGVMAALLLAADPIALGVMPLLFYIFYYFERHYPIGDVARRAAFFFIPVGLVGFFRYARLSHVDLHGSALMTIVNAVSGNGVGWLFGSAAAGQTVSLLFFLVGAVTAAYFNMTSVHRAIPVFFWLSVVLFSPYASLASRLPFAAVCLQGVASATSRQAVRMIHLLLVILGAYETWIIFAQ